MLNLETLRAEMAKSLAKVEGDLAESRRRHDDGMYPLPLLTDEGEMALAAFLGGVQRRLAALEDAATPREKEVPLVAVANPDNRLRVLDVLRASAEHFLQPGAIAEEAGLDREVVRAIAKKLADEGVLAREVRQFGPVYRYGGGAKAEAARQGAVTIETRMHHDGARPWTAELPEHSGAWEPGASEDEAIGALVNANPELFGVVVARATP